MILVPAQKILSASELVRVGVGVGFTVFVIAAEGVVHPFAFVTITFTACPLVREVVVKVVNAPFCTLTPPTLKSNVVPPPAVNVILVPAQKMLSASELVSVGTGNGFIVRITAVRVLLTQIESKSLAKA